VATQVAAGDGATLDLAALAAANLPPLAVDPIARRAAERTLARELAQADPDARAVDTALAILQAAAPPVAAHAGWLARALTAWPAPEVRARARHFLSKRLPDHLDELGDAPLTTFLADPALCDETLTALVSTRDWPKVRARLHGLAGPDAAAWRARAFVHALDADRTYVTIDLEPREELDHLIAAALAHATPDRCIQLYATLSPGAPTEVFLRALERLPAARQRELAAALARDPRRTGGLTWRWLGEALAGVRP
jgi:hypothetical protein